MLAYSDAEEPSVVSTRPMSSVLVIDDEPGMRHFLQKILSPHFALVETAEDAEAAEALRQRCHFDLLISDIRLPGKSGVEWVQELRDQGGMESVIFITAHADLDTAISALRAGAADFILKPFRADQILASVERCMDRIKVNRENFVLRRQEARVYDPLDLVGHCDVIQRVCGISKRVAPHPSTVPIDGEAGTGKELAARATHRRRGRAGGAVILLAHTLGRTGRRLHARGFGFDHPLAGIHVDAAFELGAIFEGNPWCNDVALHLAGVGNDDLLLTGNVAFHLTVDLHHGGRDVRVDRT